MLRLERKTALNRPFPASGLSMRRPVFDLRARGAMNSAFSQNGTRTMIRKTVFAVALLTSGAAFAQSSALDVIGQPERGRNETVFPVLGSKGDGNAVETAPAKDFRSTGAIEADGYLDAYSAKNRFGDKSPAH